MLALTFLMLLALKLVFTLTLSWWWVFAPVLLPTVLMLVVVLSLAGVSFGALAVSAILFVAKFAADSFRGSK